ncbi:hypothetical protein [Allonocardiopsis opalescens]|uniref:Uncharacterized protein n=1 Tax=Allonocardiopsis opalescens TaxID=1144618 RepID=A0A2T0Q9Y6_9ACTN|nr:hypothetical protein [Allonocardiopsis opalescens]PRY00709.1 hypothetical protein CLV72_102341 [Allonocardiopsis opalescens]
MESTGPLNPGIRRLCFSADLKSYGSRDDVGQYEAQRALPKVLETSCRRAGLERAHWTRQPQGDGELALLPPGIDEARTISGLVRELRVALFHYNRDRAEHARLRVRLAAHEGIVHLADNGFAGDAVVTVSRLCESEPAKDALERHPGSDLVLIVSDRIFTDVIRHNHDDLLAEDFREVPVSVPAKNFAATAWLHVPGRPASEPAGGERPAAAPGPDGTANTVSGSVGGDAVLGRDVDGSRHVSGDYYERIEMPNAHNTTFGGRHKHYGKPSDR